MIKVCAWCEEEERQRNGGKPTAADKKAEKGEQVTHGICAKHKANM